MQWNPTFIDSSPIFNQLTNYLPLFLTHTDWPSLVTLNTFFDSSNVNSLGYRVSFVSQPDARSNLFAEGYEPQIYLRGRVPTRKKNWHDLFNLLAWHQFPRAKAAINKLHYQQQLSRFGMTRQRTPLEDALTLFDENGIVVASDNSFLNQLLRNHCWQELFWQHRKEVQRDMKFIVFGHALFEKALNPYLGMTAKIIFIDTQGDIDTLLTDFLLSSREDLKPSTLSPLPILGVPDWWDDNNSPCFYQNERYFR